MAAAETTPADGGKLRPGGGDVPGCPPTDRCNGPPPHVRPIPAGRPRRSRSARKASQRTAALWYRLGLSESGLQPPERYLYAYELGCRMATIRGESMSARFGDEVLRRDL